MGALAEATRGDVHLVVQSCPTLADAPPIMRNMAEGGIKGFILPPPLCDDQSILDLVAELGAVAIAVGPGKATGTQASVTIDDFQAAYRSEEHTSELQSL